MNSIERVSAQNISRAYVQNADGAQTAGTPGKAHKTHHNQAAQAPKADSVNLSDSARALAAAREAVHNAPDVREQKVADIKQRVTDGTYQVSAQALAKKMLGGANDPS